jgi:hypothetical protein
MQLLFLLLPLTVLVTLASSYPAPLGDYSEHGQSFLARRMSPPAESSQTARKLSTQATLQAKQIYHANKATEHLQNARSTAQRHYKAAKRVNEVMYNGVVDIIDSTIDVGKASKDLLGIGKEHAKVHPVNFDEGEFENHHPHNAAPQGPPRYRLRAANRIIVNAANAIAGAVITPAGVPVAGAMHIMNIGTLPLTAAPSIAGFVKHKTLQGIYKVKEARSKQPATNRFSSKEQSRKRKSASDDENESSPLLKKKIW